MPNGVSPREEFAFEAILGNVKNPLLKQILRQRKEELLAKRLKKTEDPNEIFSGGFFRDVIDGLSVGSYATAGFFSSLFKGKNPVRGAALGIKRRKEWEDVLRELGVKKSVLRDVAGFALDVVADPLTYVGFGALKGVTGGLKAAGAVKSAVRFGTSPSTKKLGRGFIKSGDVGRYSDLVEATDSGLKAGRLSDNLSEEALETVGKTSERVSKATGTVADIEKALEPTGRFLQFTFPFARASFPLLGRLDTPVWKFLGATTRQGARIAKSIPIVGDVIRGAEKALKLPSAAIRAVGSVTRGITRRATAEAIEKFAVLKYATSTRPFEQYMEALATAIRGGDDASLALAKMDELVKQARINKKKGVSLFTREKAATHPGIIDRLEASILKQAQFSPEFRVTAKEAREMAETLIRERTPEKAIFELLEAIDPAIIRASLTEENARALAIAEMFDTHVSRGLAKGLSEEAARAKAFKAVKQAHAQFVRNMDHLNKIIETAKPLRKELSRRTLAEITDEVRSLFPQDADKIEEVAAIMKRLLDEQGQEAVRLGLFDEMFEGYSPRILAVSDWPEDVQQFLKKNYNSYWKTIEAFTKKRKLRNWSTLEANILFDREMLKFRDVGAEAMKLTLDHRFLKKLKFTPDRDVASLFITDPFKAAAIRESNQVKAIGRREFSSKALTLSDAVRASDNGEALEIIQKKRAAGAAEDEWIVYHNPFDKQREELWVVRSEVARAMNKMNGIKGDPTLFTRAMQPLIRWWKSWTLGMFPGFIKTAARNVAGAAQLGYIADVDPKVMMRTMGAPWGMLDDEMRALYTEFRLQGGILHNQLEIEVRGNPVFDIFDPRAKKRMEGKFGLFGSRSPLVNVGHQFIQWGDEWHRFFVYADRRLKGLSEFDSLNEVRKFAFDYDDLTETEEYLRNTVFPFYTWARKNISIQIQQMFTRPGKFATIAKGLRAVSLPSKDTPPEEAVASWIQDSLGIPFRKLPNGRVEYFVLESWLPAADVARLRDPMRFFQNLFAPHYRVPAEWFANRDFYFQQDIERFPGEKTFMFGLPLKKTWRHFLRNIRFLNDLDRMHRVFLSKRPPTKEEITAGQFFLRQVVGLNPYNQDIHKNINNYLRQLDQQAGKAKGMRDYFATFDLQKAMTLEEQRQHFAQQKLDFTLNNPLLVGEAERQLKEARREARLRKAGPVGKLRIKAREKRIRFPSALNKILRLKEKEEKERQRGGLLGP